MSDRFRHARAVPLKSSGAASVRVAVCVRACVWGMRGGAQRQTASAAIAGGAEVKAEGAAPAAGDGDKAALEAYLRKHRLTEVAATQPPAPACPPASLAALALRRAGPAAAREAENSAACSAAEGIQGFGPPEAVGCGARRGRPLRAGLARRRGRTAPGARRQVLNEAVNATLAAMPEDPIAHIVAALSAKAAK